MPLLRIAGKDGERTATIASAITTIGRDATNMIPLEDPLVESRHCQIERTPDGKFRVVDLNTRTGTQINGQQANFRILQNRDEIRVGNTRLIWMQEDAPGPRPAMLKFRLRRGRLPRRRRTLILPKERKGPKFDYEDLNIVFESLVEQHGIEALDEIRRILDEHFESHTGTPVYESLIHDRENLFKLVEVIKYVNTQHDLKKLLELILDQAIEMTAAERGFLVLLEGESLSIRVARNFDREAIQSPDNQISRTLAQQVIQTGRAVVSHDAMADTRLSAADSVTEMKLRSLACVPFRVREKVIGCLYLDNRTEPSLFTEEDLPILQAFADQSAVAIQNAHLVEQLKQSQDELERLNRRLKERVERQYEEYVKMREDLVKTYVAPEYKYDYSKIVGRSRPMQELFLMLDKIIDQTTPVLILGESGTGKELVARAIHYNGPRRDGKFVSQNCAAIPEALLESELFGHEKGAFTGAVTSKPGLFEQANGGTLFLDEIADMSVEMQAKLLRAIEYGEVRRVGGQQAIRVDVRLISATNKDVKRLIQEGKFREDLYYRLNVVTFQLPPLRNRREDIPLLVEHFLNKLARKEGRPAKRIDEAALALLRGHDWPGNIRELENEIHRAWAMSGDTITVDSLRDEIRQQRGLPLPAALVAAGGLKEIIKAAVEDLERRVISDTLSSTGWKKSEAARLLGISRPTLDAKIEEYRLERP